MQPMMMTPAPALSVPRLLSTLDVPLPPQARRLAEHVEHVLELVFERPLGPGERAALDAAVLSAAAQPLPGPWALDLFEQLAVDATTERVVLPEAYAPELDALARLLRRLAGTFGLEVEDAPWGVDWSIPELQLRVYLQRAEGTSAYEVLRL
jgi:hypothetical protein